MTGATTQDVAIVHDLIAARDTWRLMIQAALDKLRAEQLEHALTTRRYHRLLEEHRRMRDARDACRARYTRLLDAYRALRDTPDTTTPATVTSGGGRPGHQRCVTR